LSLLTSQRALNKGPFFKRNCHVHKSNKAERGESPQGVAAQCLAPPRNLFDAKIPENAFSASKSRPFSGHFAAAETENAERFLRRWHEKNRFFDAAESPDFIPPGTKR